MEKIWELIENFLQENAQEIFESLNEPAKDEEIAELEDQLGLKLPDEFKTSLKIHNGEGPDEGWIFSDWSLLPISEILACYNQEKNKVQEVDILADEYTLPVLWSPKWIPFAYDGSGGYLSIDLSPASQGVVGQVIMTTHGDANKKITDSFKVFMEKYYNALISDCFEIDEDELEVKTGCSEWWKI